MDPWVAFQVDTYVESLKHFDLSSLWCSLDVHPVQQGRSSAQVLGKEYERQRRSPLEAVQSPCTGRQQAYARLL
jgi:hypothetical protein